MQKLSNILNNGSAVSKQRILWFYLLSGIFIAVNAYLIIHEHYWGILMPVAIIVALMYVFWLDKLLLFIAFLTPLAVNIVFRDMGAGISIPSEPLLIGVVILFFLKTIFNGNYDKRILNHPISWIIYISLAWTLITSITSELPVVSFKFLAARIWFIVPFYFLGIALFKDFKNISKFNWLYASALIIVICYTTYRHSLYGFAEEQGHWVMKPFYNDHTAYGAILAFFLPVFVGYTFNKSRSKTFRLYSGIFAGIILLALFLSYSRAAWLSTAGIIVIAVFIVFKIKFRWIMMTVVGLITAFIVFEHEILYVLEKNKQDSSENFVEHVQSIYNISSDASNLERINRWQSAFRMFNERPIVGWGPGTYQFVYAPFQRSQERTIISTNAGDLGNAHSEYIGPLSEQGFPGLIILLVMFSMVLYTGIRVYTQARSKEIKLFSLISVLSLCTYFVHGFLNNFLDTDKASVPFWAYFAMIVAMDLYHKNERDTTQNRKSIEDYLKD